MRIVVKGLAVAAFCVWTSAARAQEPGRAADVPADGDGSVVSWHAGASIAGDVLPRKRAFELRPRVFVRAEGQWLSWVWWHLEGGADFLIADRHGAVTDARPRFNDLWLEVRGGHAAIRAGYGRVVWGRLDEVAPSDVINPIDTARFILEGRADARLPVTFVRGRIFAGERATVEGVLVPRFRSGTFDALDEASSPFNVLDDAVRPADVVVTGLDEIEPSATWANLSGGGRVDLTVGRVDVGAAVFRGFESVGPIVFEPDLSSTPTVALIGRLTERHPRFTMISSDFEAVTGAWSWRGEVAARVGRTLAATARMGLVSGRSIDAGFGFDRSAGGYRLFGSAVVHHDVSEEDPGIRRTDVDLVASVERSLSADRFRARAFVVTNPADRSSFVRGVLTWNVRDRLSLDSSAGVFLGTSDDSIGRFRGRDFVFVRMRYER